MSRSDNRYQAERWLTTGTEDLRASEALSSAGFYAQACFQAQQAGEKAVKALWYLVDADPWGHSVFRLISDFPEKAGITDLDVWLEKARVLDKFYIPTRYPNGLPDLTPGQIYGKGDARLGIEAAQFFVERCKELIATL